MSFIKLSSIIINTSKISSINIYNNKYYINIGLQDIDGFFMFGSGHISSTSKSIIICEKLHTDDYNIINKWINTVTK